MEQHIAPPDPDAVRHVVQSALAEDRARQDVTTRITVAPEQRGRGTFLAKQRGVVCGLDVVREVFGQMSPDLALTVHAPDGVAVEAGGVVAEVAGPLAAMLSGERVALNLLQRMSGTATMARSFVERAAEGGAAEITDTRKTTPGLRELERYAVRVGGARNHRDTLADGILIKDNHSRGAHSAASASRACRRRTSRSTAQTTASRSRCQTPAWRGAASRGAGRILSTT